MEDRIYESMCVNCPNEKYCHEHCDVCENFMWELEKMKKEA